MSNEQREEDITQRRGVRGGEEKAVLFSAVAAVSLPFFIKYDKFII